MESNYQPLDPRLNATEITQLQHLTTAEVTIKIPKIARSDAETLVVSSDNIIIEEMDYANVPMTDAFCVGDCILKVNDDPPQSPDHFNQIMADLSPCTVTVSRRSFVVAPGELRLRKSLIAMGLPYQKGFSYQVVVCKKQSWDRFLTTSFGFLAEDVMVPQANTNKFIIGEINTNTAAEKYFSVGDALIDFRGNAVKPQKTPDGLKQFNMVFQTGVDMEVLVERPVSKDTRNLTEQFIKKHLMRHDTPPMNEDAVTIGINASLYHHMFWRRMTAVGILIRPPPAAAAPVVSKKKSKKKKKNVGKTRRIRRSNKTREDATAIEATVENEGGEAKRITLEHKKSFQEISTDVPEGTDLETVGYRYSSDGEEEEEKKEEKEEEDETEKKKTSARPSPKKVAAAAPAAAPNVVAVPYVKKKNPKKSKRGLFSSLPFIRLKRGQ